MQKITLIRKGDRPDWVFERTEYGGFFVYQPNKKEKYVLRLDEILDDNGISVGKWIKKGLWFEQKKEYTHKTACADHFKLNGVTITFD